MAMTKCVKCSASNFELKENSPVGSRYKIWLVQCSYCGTPVGAMEYFNSGTQNQIIQNQIKELENKINNLESLIRSLRR